MVCSCCVKFTRTSCSTLSWPGEGGALAVDGRHVGHKVVRLSKWACYGSLSESLKL
jgi:hypothetical protein